LLIGSAAWQPVGGEIYRARGWAAMAHRGQAAGVLISQRRPGDRCADFGRYSPPATPPMRWFAARTLGAPSLTSAGCSPSARPTDRRSPDVRGISLFYLVIAVPFQERSLIASFQGPYSDTASS
jgi:hypothetical protein